MHEKQEILLKLSELKEKNSLSASDKSYIEEVYRKVHRFEYPRRNCGSCYPDAVRGLIIYLQNENKFIMQKSDYELKNGASLQSSNFAEHVTNKNITNELAEKFLRENPKRINFFSKFPEDWESRIEKETEAPEETEVTRRPGRPRAQQTDTDIPPM